MATMKPKLCNDCGQEFIPKGPAGKYCEVHAEERRKECGRRGTQSYRIRHGLIQKPGVGKGGNNAKGPEDSQHTTGIMFFQRNRRYYRDLWKLCNRCEKDLTEAGRYEWVIHHRDHDRTNNVEENFELLCKKCHQIEHDCHEHFNVQRPEGESS